MNNLENAKVAGSLHEHQEQELIQEEVKKGRSPLYGDKFKAEFGQMADVEMLHEPEVLNTLRHAMSVYESELENKGYTPLTINSYTSATNRFIEFLELGEVVPDFDNKPSH